MKQETINLIKSMTKQGFLVIVDPAKVNDEDRAIIKVMAWKDTDNKADVTDIFRSKKSLLKYLYETCE